MFECDVSQRSKHHVCFALIDSFRKLRMMKLDFRLPALAVLLHVSLLSTAQTSCPPPTSFCGVGTTWDDQSQTCVVAFPSDSDLDGCVQLGDLLDLLSAFGSCNDCGGGCELPNATGIFILICS